MWRSSHSKRGPARGFTLLEAMVSLLLLVIILIVAMTMLFQMRAFAERQQYFMLPRQAARRAADYLSFYLAGASDVNYVDDTHPSPNALIMYYNLNGATKQSSYNNLGCPDAVGATTCTEPGNGPRPIAANPPAIPLAIQSTNFGDIGTDIITIVAPFDPARYQVTAPMPAFGAGVDLWFNFRVACGPGPWNAAIDAANEAAFETATGYDGITQGGLLMLVDRNGSWSYVRFQKNDYQANGVGSAPPAVAPDGCTDVTPGSFKSIHVNTDLFSPLLPRAPNPVASLVDPVYLVTGLQVISFRVMTDSVDGVPKLQQKLGYFDPDTDNPGTDFVNVMENIEDLQVAYLYARDEAAGAAGAPLVWNTSTQTINAAAPGCAALPAPGCAPGVPFQAGPNFVFGPLPPLDISNVIGVRFSVTGRSPRLPIGARKLTNTTSDADLDVVDESRTPSQHFRPASEDHRVSMDPVHLLRPLYDEFDHYRATATLMLRNRIPRG